MPGLLKRRQAVAKADPFKVVAQPRVMGWGEQIGIVEAARCYVDEARAIAVLVRQRSSTCRTKGATHGL